MGTFTVTIEVGDPGGQRFERLEALVDTGSTNSAVPGSVLRGLGVVPHRKGHFELADGTVVEADIGRTWLRVNGDQESTQIVFAPEGTQPILGAITLEELELAVDPLKKALAPATRLWKRRRAL